MKKSKYTDGQIVAALKEHESGISASDICRRLGISSATFYNWKKKFGGLGMTEMRKLKQLEEENRQLKTLVAELSLDKQILQDVIKKKL
jgi:putative transposase